MHSTLGPGLYGVFREAALPAPDVVAEAPAGSGETSPAYGWANIVGALAPLMRRLGTGPDDEVDTEELTRRLNDEAAERDAIVFGPLMFGAWCRLPAA